MGFSLKELVKETRPASSTQKCRGRTIQRYSLKKRAFVHASVPMLADVSSDEINLKGTHLLRRVGGDIAATHYI